MINGSVRRPELAQALKDKLDKEHRTIIQLTMGIFKDVIEHYAENHSSDLRNEASLKWAKEVLKLKDDHYFPYI